MRIRSWRPAVAALAVALSAPAAVAELPPQYTTWADFAAVVNQSSIPNKLGVVDRIERVQGGRYVAWAGFCSVEITVVREPAKDPGGRILVGPSHIARVEVGDKRCDK